MQETSIVQHRILVPNGVKGTVSSIQSGSFHVEDAVAELLLENGETLEVNMLQKWPVRVGRPYNRKLTPDIPLVTGQRPIDTLFPIAKGGVAAIPGPFGFWQNGSAAPACQICRSADRSIYWLRGTGQRDDRCAQ